MKEKCLKCGNEIEYEEINNELFCPDCGWSKKAAKDSTPSTLNTAKNKDLDNLKIRWLISTVIIWGSFGLISIISKNSINAPIWDPIARGLGVIILGWIAYTIITIVRGIKRKISK